MNIEENFVDRLSLFYSIQEKGKFAEEIEIEKCRRDVIYFCNNWCYTFDPRNKPKHFPFNLYEYQEKVFTWLNERYDNKQNGLIEKSRDMGASWLICAWTVHKWLFDDGFTALYGSRKEDLVDNHMMDSLFGKLRYIIYRLPEFLRPDIQEGTKTDRHLTLLNPNNGNEIQGESANIGFGRGGRASICFIDEFAHVEHSEAIWASISENSDCIIPLSTPNGKSNQFAWLKFESNIPVLSLHWSLHPHKTQKWYEKKKSQMKPWQIAQELDLSYERSLEGRVHSRFDRKYNISKDIIYCNPEYEQFIAWDFGIVDPTAMLFGQITESGFPQIWANFEMTDFDIDFYIPLAKGMKPKEYPKLTTEQKTLIDKLLKKVPFNHRSDHYGDNAGTARTANAVRTCRDALKENGMILKTSGRQSFDWRIECVDKLLKLRFNETQKEWYSIVQVSPDCERFIDCMFNYVYDSENISDDKLKPKHNWASHMVTAFEFFTINRFPIKTTNKTMWEQQIR